MYVCMYVCIYVCTQSCMEIDGFASPNANHFWGRPRCESLWPTDSQYFKVIANQFKPIANHCCYWIRKKTPFREVLFNKEQPCEQIANHC